MTIVKTINMIRIKKTDSVTMGTFLFNNKQYYTVEDPDKNNSKYISCIPAGIYTCELAKSDTNKSAGIDVAYSVIDVPGNRDMVRFAHVGNSSNDVEGCVAIGLKPDFISGTILKSCDAVKRFYREMDELYGLNPFTLKIVDAT